MYHIYAHEEGGRFIYLGVADLDTDPDEAAIEMAIERGYVYGTAVPVWPLATGDRPGETHPPTG